MSMTKKNLYNILFTSDFRIPANNTTWFELLSLAIIEKVEGYLYKVLYENAMLKIVPKQMAKILYISYRYNIEKNTLYLREYEQICNLLTNKQIIAVPCRGISLISNIYIDYGLRYMEDIDILIPQISLEVLKKILNSVGYRLSLINDVETGEYSQAYPISSCLFTRVVTETKWISHIKLDFSFATHQTRDLSQTLETMFTLMCKSLYNSALENSENPIPEDCSLTKLIDVILFYRKYPIQTDYILKHSKFSTMDFTKYTIRCVEYFSKEEHHER